MAHAAGSPVDSCRCHCCIAFDCIDPVTALRLADTPADRPVDSFRSRHRIDCDPPHLTLSGTPHRRGYTHVEVRNFDNPDNLGCRGGFAIHPNGRQIAYVGMAGKQGAEVWALENFLSAASARK